MGRIRKEFPNIINTIRKIKDEIAHINRSLFWSKFKFFTFNDKNFHLLTINKLIKRIVVGNIIS
jgi:hypothetical protein